MTLYEIGISNPRVADTTQPSDFQRLEILYPCLESVGNFFEKFLEMPPASYWNVSLIYFSHLAYALKILQRLSILEDPTWDLSYVAGKVNFARILDEVGSRMREALRYGGQDPSITSESISVFARTSAKLGKLKMLFETQMASTQSAPEQMGSMDVGDLMILENMAGFWELDQFNLMGGDWGGF